MLNRADWIPQTATGAAIGTAATTLLSKGVVNGGVYHLKFQVILANVGSPTNINFGLSGVTATSANWMLMRNTASGGTPRYDMFTSIADAVAGTAIVTTWATGEGLIVPSQTGTLNIRGIRVAGTSSTVQVGSFLELERIG